MIRMMYIASCPSILLSLHANSNTCLQPSSGITPEGLGIYLDVASNLFKVSTDITSESIQGTYFGPEYEAESIYSTYH